MRRSFRSVPADAVIMTGHNLAAMMAMGDLGKGRRLLCQHYYHTGVKPVWQWRLIYRVAVRRFNAITFASDFIRREAEEIYPPLRRISHTVRNPFQLPGVPAQEDRVAARSALGIPADAKVVGNAGWLIGGKRFDVFLRVAAKVLAALPDAFFVVAGDGPLRSELAALAESLGVAPRVRWLGWQKDLGWFYQSLDVLLFNSDWDAMGRTPLEALAFGVPVVASVLHGGLREVFDSERYGYLLGRHDVDWLADRTIRLLEDPERARELGLAGRARLAAVGSVERHADKICELLRLE